VSLPTLLLVDDSESVLAYESAALSRDYALRTATDGRRALAAMREECPDLVLLDLSMPVCNGDQVLSEMRHDPELEAVPVIIVTTEAERAEACLKAGANAYLPKPIRAEDLRAVVARVLREARSSREAYDLRTLVVRIGDRLLGVPLRTVRHVVLQPATEALPLADGTFIETFDFHGEVVSVVEGGTRLGLTSTAELVDRWIVILVGPEPTLGLAVDEIQGPEVFPRDSVEPSCLAEDEPDPDLGVPVLAHVRTGPVRLPIVVPDVAIPAGLRALVREALLLPARGAAAELSV
jgi:CheY-like chemotaxis protein/chemotaxis signal transduction protein